MPEPSADLDLRLVRYFTLVAEHRHFGRAATELRVAQPSLSRQIRRLEKQVGARLFDRGADGARLTDAGRAFLTRAEVLLHTATEATEAARTAGRADRITIGYAADILITDVVAELRRRHPDATVDALHLAWNEPIAALTTGRVDVVVARLPLPAAEGVTVDPLFDEPRLVMLAVDHRLAGRASVTLDDIADEPLPRVSDDEFDAFWRIDPRPDGSPAPDGPVVPTLADKLELVAAGRALAVVPAGVRANHLLRRDLTTVALDGVAPAEVVVVTRTADDSHLTAEFRELARTHITSPGAV